MNENYLPLEKIEERLSARTQRLVFLIEFFYVDFVIVLGVFCEF